MLKSEELSDPNSCWNRAREDELIFVLLERDEDAPGTIRDWIARRIKSGKNRSGDKQMVEAGAIALAMEMKPQQRRG